MANVKFGLMQEDIRDDLEEFFVDLVAKDERLKKDVEAKIIKDILKNKTLGKELREELDSYFRG